MSIVILFFLFIYNPSFKLMSSGFTRYILFFLVINLYGLDVIKYGLTSIVTNSQQIKLKSLEMRCTCYAIQILTFILSYVSASIFLNDLIEPVLGKSAEPFYSVSIFIACSILLVTAIRYSGLFNYIAFITLSFLRGIHISFTQPDYFIIILCVYWLFLTTYFFGIPVYLNTYDFTFPGYLLQILLLVFITTFLAIRYLNKMGYFSFEDLLRLLSYTIALQSIFIILEWFYSPFSTFIQTVLVKNTSQISQIRSSGITGLAGDGLSLVQAFGAILSYQIFMFSDSVKRKWRFVILFILQTISIVFVARTGFVLVTFFICTSLIFNRCRFANAFRLFKLITISLIVSVLLYLLLVPPDIKVLMEEKFFPWAFEFVFSFIEKGTFETASTTEIRQNMLFLPDNMKSILIGDGYFQDPGNPLINYMGTDSGYVRLIFFAGFIGSLLFYAYFILMTYLMCRISFDRKRVSFILSVMSMLFIAQIKIPFLSHGTTHIFLLLFYFSLLNENRLVDHLGTWHKFSSTYVPCTANYTFHKNTPSNSPEAEH